MSSPIIYRWNKEAFRQFFVDILVLFAICAAVGLLMVLADGLEGLIVGVFLLLFDAAFVAPFVLFRGKGAQYQLHVGEDALEVMADGACVSRIPYGEDVHAFLAKSNVPLPAFRMKKGTESAPHVEWKKETWLILEWEENLLLLCGTDWLSEPADACSLEAALEKKLPQILTTKPDIGAMMRCWKKGWSCIF